jgi:hypothetical protein
MNKPVIIFSMPTKNKTMETRITIERNVRPGNAIATPDSIIANMPRPICAQRIHPDDEAF